ncbi:hypothetical protein, partial [Alcaligenes faecalis]|uniref:hypothetical protein n=1 Tax=Alcaligenes faecalis TaxID=511 RepID=UPI001CB7043E
STPLRKAQTARPEESRPKTGALLPQALIPKLKTRNSKKTDTPPFKKEGQRFKTNTINLTPSAIFSRR